MKEFLKRGRQSIYTYQEFIELWDKMPSLLTKSKNMADINFLLKKIFSNFVVSQNKVEKYTLNEPFKELELFNDTRRRVRDSNP